MREKLIKEIDEHIKDVNNLNYDNINNLNYLNAFMKESLRLYSSVLGKLKI